MLSGLTLASLFNFCLAFALLGQTVIAQSLKDAAGANFYVGAAVSITTLGDATFKSLAASEFSSVTAENEMKWCELSFVSVRNKKLIYFNSIVTSLQGLFGETTRRVHI